MRALTGGAVDPPGSRPAALPEPGTRVVLMWRGTPRHGAVQAYEARWEPSAFPVRFDDGLWALLGSDDLTLEQGSR